MSPLAMAVESPTGFNSLRDHSPFGGPATQAPVEKTPEPIEFRAVVDENNIQYFSFFDVTARRSIWLVLNSPAGGITAREYNPATLMISVEYQGKSLHLPLKGAIAQTWREPIKSADSKSPDSSLQTQYGDRPFRIGHVLEEAAIRQAVRQE